MLIEEYRRNCKNCTGVSGRLRRCALSGGFGEVTQGKKISRKGREVAV